MQKLFEKNKYYFKENKIAPATIKTTPINPLILNVSPKKISAKINTKAILKRSIATTAVACPSFKAKK